MLATDRRLGRAPRRCDRAARTDRRAPAVGKLPLPDRQDVFCADLIASMPAAVQAGGHSLVSHALDRSGDVAAAVRTLQEHEVDGLTLPGGDRTDDVRQLAAAGDRSVLTTTWSARS